MNIEEFLDLVNCSHDYGFYNEVLMSSFAEMTGWISDKQILDYANGFLSEEMKFLGYADEDRDAALETVTNWRNEFCKEE